MVYPIHTIDSRDNIQLEMIRSTMQLGDRQMHKAIVDAKSTLDDILKYKKIQYEELKNILVPHADRKEILLLFDFTLCESSSYGIEIFKQYFPLLSSIHNKTKNSKHFVHFGDIGIIDSREGLKNLQREIINSGGFHRFPFPLPNPLNLCGVYINNLSNDAFEKLSWALHGYSPYVGHIDCTFDSKLKQFISLIFPPAFLKLGNKILIGHPDDIENSDNVNYSLYPFESFGSQIISLQEMYYELFLCYKIERPVLKHYDSDAKNLLNSIAKAVAPIEECEVVISDDKYNYIREKKGAQLKRMGVWDFSSRELAALIKSKLLSTYLYNFRIHASDEAALFSMVIEINVADTKSKMKASIGLKYFPKLKEVFITTMF